MESTSITRIYDRMRAGDDEAARVLWEKFATQLAARAKSRLTKRRVAAVVGPEDAVIDVFDTLIRRARQGRFPHIDSREDLWRLLLTLTDRKCALAFRHFNTKKRGGNQRIVSEAGGDSAAPQLNNVQDASWICQPEVVVIATETYDRLMSILDEHDEDLRLAEMAELRMAGWSNQEIGERIDRSTQVVERRFKLIRTLWSEWDPR